MKKQKHKKIKKKNKIISKSNNKNYIYLYIGILALMIILAFARTNSFEFVHIDDGKLIYNNPLITDNTIPYSECFRSKIKQPYYKPLTFLSWKIEYNLFGSNAGHFHFFNWLLHLINAVLVFFIGIKIFKRIFNEDKIVLLSAFLVAAFFAVNPLRVESVAWATERKDVLFSLFFLSGWFMYIKYNESKKYYFILLSAALYLLSGLSKSMGITMLAVIFIYDFWLNRKLNFRIVMDKIPFIIVFIVLLYLYGFMDFGSETGGKIINENLNSSQALDTSFLNRFPHFLQWVMSASLNYILWILHSIFPFKLSVVYPHNKIFNYFSYGLLLMPLIIIWLYYYAWKHQKSNKILLMGLLFYGFTLAPVLTYTSAGQAIFLSDRYTYIPSIGLFFILVYYIIKLKNAYKNWYYIPFGILFIYFLLTMKNVSNWKNSKTLFSNALTVFPESPLAHLNLGLYYKEKNNLEKAIDIYSKGLKFSNGYYRLYQNRGKIYFDQGRIKLALKDFNKSLSIFPDNSNTLSNRGAAYGFLKDYDNALVDLIKALELNPQNLDALSNRGFIYFKLGKYKETIADYREYLRFNKNDPDIINTIGMALARLHRTDEAIKEFSKAISLNNKKGAFFLNRSYAYKSKNNTAKALQDAITAKNLGFNVNPKYIQSLK